MQVKDTAICLRAVNYSETSQVVTLFTQDSGKVSAMAKGSRRAKSAFDGPIELFSFGDVVFTTKDSGGQLAILTEFSQWPRFPKFKRDLYTLNAALFAAELTEHFLEDHDPHPELFSKFRKFLETLQDTETDSAVLAWLILYQLRLLEETGIALMLDACVNCGTSFSSPPAKGQYSEGGRGLYFSSRENGILCSNCEMTFPEKRAIEPSLLSILNTPARLPKTDKKNLQKIENLLIYHFTELLHKPPKLAKHFLR
jgi:DNA repair protein RecO (recombination protein O)